MTLTRRSFFAAFAALPAALRTNGKPSPTAQKRTPVTATPHPEFQFCLFSGDRELSAPWYRRQPLTPGSPNTITFNEVTTPALVTGYGVAWRGHILGPWPLPYCDVPKGATVHVPNFSLILE